jgi:sensor domain CHASE-containing protein
MGQGDRPPSPPGLDQRIDELEALLAAARREKASADGWEAQNTPAHISASAAIPILDEEVTGPGPAHPVSVDAAGDAPAPQPVADAMPSPEAVPGQRLTPRQLVELGQRLQQRMDAELEELTDVIRSVVKRCILEELRKELPQVGNPAAKKPDSR